MEESSTVHARCKHSRHTVERQCHCLVLQSRAAHDPFGAMHKRFRL